MHSHNYTPEQAYKRSFGEARALAAVWNGGPAQMNWCRTVLLGWLNDLRRDFFYCTRTRRISELPHAARIRWSQRRARLAGFRAGWDFYRKNDEDEPRKSMVGRASCPVRVAPRAVEFGAPGDIQRLAGTLAPPGSSKE